MKELAQTGMSTYKIGVLLGRDDETIRRKMASLAIPRGSKGRSGPESHEWEGGMTHAKGGYVLVYVPSHPHPNKGRYVLQHRLVMEQHLGRFLEPEEVVHHKDGNRQNNAPDNLELWQRNGDHLQGTLKGHVPEWTAEGKARMIEGSHKKRGRHYLAGSLAAKARPPLPRGADGRYLKSTTDALP
jgi:hypothetical protein